MPNANLLDLFWKGFELESSEQLDAQTLQLRLSPKSSHPPCCSRCGHATFLVHDVGWRRERDLFEYRVWLDVPVRRVRCPTCGPTREHIPWLAGRRPLTQAMGRRWCA